MESCFVYPVKVYNRAGELTRTIPVKELIDEMFKEFKPKKQRILSHANCAYCGDRFGKVRERQRFCKIDCQRQWARDDKKAKRRAKTVTKNVRERFHNSHQNQCLLQRSLQSPT